MHIPIMSPGLRNCLQTMLCLLVLSISGQASAAGYARAQWEQQGWLTHYEDGLQLAHKTGKPLLVYFDAAWCSWCQQYKRETLDTQQVRTILQRDFIRVAVDYDARPDLMRHYEGRGLPYTLILAADAQLLVSYVGVMSSQDMLAILEKIATQTGAQPVKAPAVLIHQADSIDHAAYLAFRKAYLQHLDTLYDPLRQNLSGQFASGVTQKRTSMLVWMYLMQQNLWTERVHRAARAERLRLWDKHGYGYFNFVDPARDEYVETSKLLEVNAWMAAWQAQLGACDKEAKHRAGQTFRYLREVLWDQQRGGFYQAQVADNLYYAQSPAKRQHRSAPPVDRAKRTDSNAQAVWALLRMYRISGDPQLLAYATNTLAFVMRDMWHDGALYHLWREGNRSLANHPHNWFWVLAAGAELERVQPQRERKKQLADIAAIAANWLKQRMQNSSGAMLDNELAGLIAYVAGQQKFYPEFSHGEFAWAIRQLRIETETTPDELVIGMLAWEKSFQAQ